jgi:uncharacterized protein (TIGR02145 family)
MTATSPVSITGTPTVIATGAVNISIAAATTSTAGSMSADDKTKLDGIATGAEVNVNADWNAVTGDAQIQNKPTTIAGYGITDAVATAGNQTIAGNKTFTGTTTVPTPVNANDAVTKNYTDIKYQALLMYLINNGANIVDLKNAGVTASELKACGFNATDLAFFTATELKAAGFTATELKAASFTLQELVDVPTILVSELIVAGYTIHGQTGTLSDNDGHTYNWIGIGNQIWMQQNLNTSKYQNGDAIPNVTDNATWGGLTTGAYCDYSNTPSNSTTYGKLYNFYSVADARKISPASWHVPTDAEYTTMENYLIANGYNYDGTTSGNKIAKALGASSGWTFYSGVGAIGNTDYPAKRNASGFTALPGGYRYFNGTYYSIGNSGSWWSATEHSTAYAWYRYLFYNNYHSSRSINTKSYGFSVRCLRD